jgi:hypothetical protein
VIPYLEVINIAATHSLHLRIEVCPLKGADPITTLRASTAIFTTWTGVASGLTITSTFSVDSPLGPAGLVPTICPAESPESRRDLPSQQNHPSPAVPNTTSPATRGSSPTPAVHHGRIRARADFWHNLRDNEQVRTTPHRKYTRWTDLLRRYTDLQPVGMGAFGLVWYVHRGEEKAERELTWL